MKSILKITAGLLFAILLMPTMTKAQLKLPQISPKASVTQTMGLTDITIDYHCPSVKGRKIWGALVPYDSLWRTGANEATAISFSDDVMIEGNKLAAGRYALFTIPGKSEWTIIFNKKKDMNSAFGYKKEEDALRVKVKPLSNANNESMEFWFSDITINSCTINLMWEKLHIPFKVTTETDTKVMAIINDSLKANPNKVSLLRQAAGYTVTSGLHLDNGLEWINKAISIKSEYRTFWTKAQLLAKMGKYNDAVDAANKTLDLGKDDKDFAEMKPIVEKNLAEYQGKAKK